MCWVSLLFVIHEIFIVIKAIDVVVVDGIGEVVNGRLSAPMGPGLGVTPRLDALGDPVAVYH